jgi:hypothetical protein
MWDISGNKVLKIPDGAGQQWLRVKETRAEQVMCAGALKQAVPVVKVNHWILQMQVGNPAGPARS